MLQASLLCRGQRKPLKLRCLLDSCPKPEGFGRCSVVLNFGTVRHASSFASSSYGSLGWDRKVFCRRIAESREGSVKLLSLLRPLTGTVEDFRLVPTIASRGIVSIKHFTQPSSEFVSMSSFSKPSACKSKLGSCIESKTTPFQSISCWSHGRCLDQRSLTRL